jgi:hypothetical protein
LTTKRGENPNQSGTQELRKNELMVTKGKTRKWGVALLLAHRHGIGLQAFIKYIDFCREITDV